MSGHVGKTILDTAHAIKHTMNAYVDRPGLNGLQVRILEYIARADRKGGEVFRGDIEAFFKISRPSVTSVLNTMEKNGYIRRETVPRDARLKKLTLTPKARQIEKDMYSRVEKFESILSRGLTERQTAALEEILGKITDNIKNMKR